jgi:hypothetical protein
MNTSDDVADARPCAVAFAHCFDATIFGRVVAMMAPSSRSRTSTASSPRASSPWRPATASWTSMGTFARPWAARSSTWRWTPSRPARSPRPRYDARVGVRAGGRIRGRPAELGHALWGDLLFEVLRVADDEKPDPVPAVCERVLRGSRAIGEGRTLRTTRLRGCDAGYVLFASAA